MRRCEDEKMWRGEDVKMRRCKDEKMWRGEDVKMKRCEDEKMWRWEDVKMRRCFTDPHYWKNPALRRSREKSLKMLCKRNSHNRGGGSPMSIPFGKWDDAFCRPKGTSSRPNWDFRSTAFFMLFQHIVGRLIQNWILLALGARNNAMKSSLALPQICPAMRSSLILAHRHDATLSDLLLALARGWGGVWWHPLALGTGTISQRYDIFSCASTQIFGQTRQGHSRRTSPPKKPTRQENSKSITPPPSRC